MFRGVFVVLKLFFLEGGEGIYKFSKIACLGEGYTCVVQYNIHTLKSLIFIPFKKYISHRCQFYSDFVETLPIYPLYVLQQLSDRFPYHYFWMNENFTQINNLNKEGSIEFNGETTL